MRELARVTIRARGLVLAKWDVLREAENLAPHAFFELLVESYYSRLDPERQGEILRAARRRRRDHYSNVP